MRSRISLSTQDVVPIYRIRTSLSVVFEFIEDYVHFVWKHLLVKIDRLRCRLLWLELGFEFMSEDCCCWPFLVHRASQPESGCILGILGILLGLKRN